MITAEEIAFRALRAVVRMMAAVPLGPGRFLGGLMGTGVALLPIPRLRVALDNMRFCLGGDLDEIELRRLYRRVCRHFGRMLFEIPHILTLERRDRSRYVVLEGERHLLDALGSGRGAFVLTAHFGNWELMSAAVTLRLGDRASMVARPLDFRPLERVLQELRTRYGGEIIPKQRAMRRIMASVRRGKVVGILLDQNVDWYDGAFVPFLGKTACTNKGLALLAMKTGAPVIPAFALRRPEGGYRVVFEPAMELQSTGDRVRDVEDNTARFASVITRYILDYPDHWFWFHRRWKTRNYCPVSRVEEAGRQ
jgi:Kdo2-lipid IVA lauroyltransferase/acyltransferase